MLHTGWNFDGTTLKKRVYEQIERLREMSFPIMINTPNFDNLIKKLKDIMEGGGDSLTTEDTCTLIVNSNNSSFNQELFDFFVHTYLTKNWVDGYVRPLVNGIILCWKNDYRRKELQRLGLDMGVNAQNFMYVRNANGPAILASFLRDNKVKVDNSIHVVGYKNNFNTSEYFVDVMMKYFDRKLTNIDDEIDELERVVGLYKKHIACTMVVIPFFVLHVNSLKLGLGIDVRKKINNLCEKKIGSLNDIFKWVVMNGSAEVNDRLTRTRLLLCSWICENHIYSFFGKAGTTAKVLFWKKYIGDIITTMKIAPNETCMCVFSNDIPFNGIVKKKHWNVADSVLVMRIGLYSIIESIEMSSGAYFYYEGEECAKGMMSKKIWGENDNISDMRDTSVDFLSLPTLIFTPKAMMVHKNVRIFHKDGWEKGFANWIRIKVEPILEECKGYYEKIIDEIANLLISKDKVKTIKAKNEAVIYFNKTYKSNMISEYLRLIKLAPSEKNIEYERIANEIINKQ